MNLNSLKSQYLAAKAQIVLMDEQCRLLDSCHTLFRLDKQAPTALSEQFPILESIENLFKELNDNEELFFPRVETNIDTNIYISDFTFFKNPADKCQIVWIIQDLTQQYLYFSSIQRERNELYIRNRRLEFQQEINTLQTELRYRQQIHQLQAEQMIHLSPLSENCLFNFTNTLWTLIHSISKPEHKTIPLKLEVDKNIPSVLWGNQYGLCQILYNILTTILCNTKHSELHLKVRPIQHIENRFCLQFIIEDTDVALPNYSAHLQNQQAHISAQPFLQAANMPLYIAQALLYDNGGSFENYHSDIKQTYTYLFKILFDLDK